MPAWAGSRRLRDLTDVQLHAVALEQQALLSGLLPEDTAWTPETPARLDNAARVVWLRITRIEREEARRAYANRPHGKRCHCPSCEWLREEWVRVWRRST